MLLNATQWKLLRWIQFHFSVFLNTSNGSYGKASRNRLFQFTNLMHSSFKYVYIGVKTFIYVVRHLDSIVSYLPTDLHLGFFRSWPSLFFPSSFSSVFLVLSFVSASTSMLFWAVFLLPFFEHGHTMTIPSFFNNMYVTLRSSTCFEQHPAHPQDDKLYHHSLWYRHPL